MVNLVHFAVLLITVLLITVLLQPLKLITIFDSLDYLLVVAKFSNFIISLLFFLLFLLIHHRSTELATSVRTLVKTMTGRT